MRGLFLSINMRSRPAVPSRCSRSSLVGLEAPFGQQGVLDDEGFLSFEGHIASRRYLDDMYHIQTDEPVFHIQNTTPLQASILGYVREWEYFKIK
jgi:hypothetical protein